MTHGGSHSSGDHLIREEGGFSLAEVLVAALVLAIGIIGAITLVDVATRSAYSAEQSQVALGRAQAELEKIRALPYDEIALTTAPAPSAEENDPLNRVTTSCPAQGVSTLGCFGLNRNGTNQVPMVINGDVLEEGGQVSDGTIDPGPEPFQSGDVTGNVYRFVVWSDEPNCDAPECPGTQDRKRVVIAVQLDDVAVVASRPYREIQSSFVDPDSGREFEPDTPDGGEVIAQELWLTDTPCDSASRMAPFGDHPLHNTLGDCPDGLQTGATPGAPDLILPSAPPLDPAFPPASQPIYDYASDVEPIVNPGSDGGIQVREGDAAGCDYVPSGSAAHETTHRWLTEPMPGGFQYLLEGNATLELWTRTLGAGAVQAGELCIYVFVREHDFGGNATDTVIADADNPPNPFFSFSDSAWPNAGWQAAVIPMRLQPQSAGDTVVRVGPGEQLGIAISVERDATGPEDALQFLYEHPDFDSHLEVQTTTPLPSS